MTANERIMNVFMSTSNLQSATAGRVKGIINSQTKLVTPETIDSSLRTLVRKGMLVREKKVDNEGKNVFHYNPNPTLYEYVEDGNGQHWTKKSGEKVSSFRKE